MDDPDDPDATLPDHKPVAKHHQSGSDRKQDRGQEEDGVNYKDEAIGSDFEGKPNCIFFGSKELNLVNASSTENDVYRINYL